MHATLTHFEYSFTDGKLIYFLSMDLQNYLIYPESPHLREINPRFDHKGRNLLQSAAWFDPQLNH